MAIGLDGDRERDGNGVEVEGFWNKEELDGEVWIEGESTADGESSV